jgi:hypothetical protein
MISAIRRTSFSAQKPQKWDFQCCDWYTGGISRNMQYTHFVTFAPAPGNNPEIAIGLNLFKAWHI